MKILIEIPEEFEGHFNNDRFVDGLKRISIDIKCSKSSHPTLSGLYEFELIQMLQNAMTKAEVKG